MTARTPSTHPSAIATLALRLNPLALDAVADEVGEGAEVAADPQLVVVLGSDFDDDVAGLGVFGAAAAEADDFDVGLLGTYVCAATAVVDMVEVEDEVKIEDMGEDKGEG